MFQIDQFLYPNDPWVEADGVEFLRRIYREKHALAQLLRPERIVESYGPTARVTVLESKNGSEAKALLAEVGQRLQALHQQVAVMEVAGTGPSREAASRAGQLEEAVLKIEHRISGLEETRTDWG